MAHSPLGHQKEVGWMIHEPMGCLCRKYESKSINQDKMVPDHMDVFPECIFVA